MSRKPIDASNLHRTAKLFMDDGSAATAEAAMDRLRGFGLTIIVGADIATSRAAQIALLTLVNVARRTFLAGIEVVGLPDAMAIVLMPDRHLDEAVRELGGATAAAPRSDWPVAAIGDGEPPAGLRPAWQVTWQCWNGGVIPSREGRRLSNDESVTLAPALAAAICAAEVFSYHAGEPGMAGRRSAGLSLWSPGADWLDIDTKATTPAYLPSRLWLIGLGNLGQAFSWLLACLPYPSESGVRVFLQDDDIMAESNDSTSLLATSALNGVPKTRAVASWLEARGFATSIEERRFGPWITRTSDEPGVAFCGVDNALARASIEQAGFDLVIEAGLGAGAQAFRSFSVHAFPGSRSAAEIWAPARPPIDNDPLVGKPAYAALEHAGMDVCGLAMLASRTVGVPFVGLTAVCIAMAELLRRLCSAPAHELVAGSMLSLADASAVPAHASPWTFGHLPIEGMG